MGALVVCSGGHTHIICTTATDWVAATTLFLTVLEMGKSKVKALTDPVPGESPLPGTLMTFF